MRFGDRCVAVDPFDKTPPQIEVDPPLHTREVGIVRLTADEPAVIYYTVDGSSPTLESAHEPDNVVITGVPDDAQLRYFAVDLAGNRSDEQSRIWVIDRAGPAAPVDFRLMVTGASRIVTWSPPPDPRLGGVLVARVDGPLVAGPVPGEKYEVGAVLSPGVTIVHATDAAATGPAMFAESTTTPPGMIRYVAWAFDDLYNYGPPAGDYVLVALPPQTGRIQVDAATGQVTTMLAPPNVTLSGTASLTGSTLSAKITIKNETSRVLFAPKLLVTNNVASWSNSDGTHATFPYRAYGAALPPGETSTQTLTFTGATATTTITLDVDIRDGYIVTTSLRDRVSAGSIVDFATGQLLLKLDSGSVGPRGGAMTMRGAITPDARLVIGSRNAGTVSAFDLTTGKRVREVQLRPQKAHVPQLILDRSGSAVYAFVAEGHRPRNTTGIPTTLVRLDAATLTESGRLDLDDCRNRDVTISADGKTMLVATGVTAKGVIVIDLPTFTIKQRILPGFRTQAVMFTPDGGSVVAVGEQVAVYDLADGDRTALWPTPGTTNSRVLRATLSSPTQLWIGRRDELVSLDIVTGTSTAFDTIEGRMLEFFDGKLYTGNGSTLSRVALDGTVETTLPGFTNLDSHWVGRSPF